MDCIVEDERRKTHDHQVRVYGLTKTRDVGDPNYFIENTYLSKNQKDENWLDRGLEAADKEFFKYLRRHKLPNTCFSPKPPRGEGFIYFFREFGRPRVKIGFTNDIGIRKRATQVHCSEYIQSIGYLIAPRSREKELHEQFDADRIRGEWFHLSEAIQDFIVNNLTLPTQKELEVALNLNI